MSQQALLAATISALVGLAVASRGAQGKGTIHGRLRLDLPGVQLAHLGPTVAYLDADRDEAGIDPWEEIPRISQSNATFSPDFLIVTAGQTVQMPNDDNISHNVFSLSPTNGFDLGIYPRGISKTVTFRQPEAVRIYCSIHKSMNATIFVAPSPYYARVAPDGSFELAGVPVGEHRLEIWSRKLPQVTRPLEVVAGEQEITVTVALQPENRASTTIREPAVTHCDRCPGS